MSVIGSASLSAAARAVAGPRATLSSPDRVDAMRAASRLVAASPLVGSGPGQARTEWIDPDGVVVVLRYVHNEYLQVAADLGLVGAALLVLFLFGVGRIIWSARGSGPTPTLWAGVVAGVAALAAHSTLDFVWHLAAIPLIAAALIGIATSGPAVRHAAPSNSNLQ
jgi:O-antigen ligase